MLRVLTITTMFPDTWRPNLAPFVERQLVELATLPDVAVRVMAPVLTGPFPFSARPRYRWLRSLPHAEVWNSLEVHRPRVPILPYAPRLRPYLLAMRLIPLLAALRKSFPFDVIGAETFWPDGPAAMLVARSFRLPFLIKARGDDILVSGNHSGARKQMLSAARRAGRLLAVSGALRDRMVVLGMAAEKISVHYNGVDRAMFSPAERQAAKARANLVGPVLLCVGSLTERKQQRLLLDALQHIPDATLILAGGGPERQKLEQQARDLRLSSRLRFLGVVPQAQLPALYAAADVTVLPTKREGLANAWLESLACGRPVVTTDAEGAREVFRRPEAGRIVPHSAAAIAAAVHELLAQQYDPNRVAAAIADFTWAKNAAELRGHYKAVAGQ